MRKSLVGELHEPPRSFRCVAPQVREAAHKAAAQLEQLGIRYVLAGDLAVGAHGYVQATTHVEFLVGEEAFGHHGMVVTFKAGVPIEVNGIRIDYLSAMTLGSHIEAVFAEAPRSEGIMVVPLATLIYLKLVAKRRQDQVDVIELIKGGADVKGMRHYLQKYAVDLLPLFEELVNEAMAK